MVVVQYSASGARECRENILERSFCACLALCEGEATLSEQILEARSISKRYGENLVLDAINFELRSGEAVAVIGENGAGKSTLAKIMAGVIRPDTGDIRLGGTSVSFHSPRDALGAGIGFIPQELAYFPDLSIAENILVGTWPSKLGFVSHRELMRRAGAAIRRFGIELDMRRPMRSLKIGERQLVEIAKALSREAKLVILDEPTAALTAAESHNLFEVLAGLAQQGHGVLYISHRMDEVFRFSDRVDVLRNGRLVASASPRETSPRYLIEQMLGEAARELTATATAARSNTAPALRVSGWRKAGEPGLKDVSFEVACGEVVLSLPLQANLSLLILRSVSRLGFLRRRAERASARLWTQRLSVRFRSLGQPTGELSGGNQQKVMVASRLATQPKLFALQEPTRGVDVRARVELHRFLREFASRGVGILVATTDVEEAVLVTDRLLVMREGALIAELVGKSKTQGRALALAAGEEA